MQQQFCAFFGILQDFLHFFVVIYLHIAIILLLFAPVKDFQTKLNQVYTIELFHILYNLLDFIKQNTKIAYFFSETPVFCVFAAFSVDFFWVLQYNDSIKIAKEGMI